MDVDAAETATEEEIMNADVTMSGTVTAVFDGTAMNATMAETAATTGTTIEATGTMAVTARTVATGTTAVAHAAVAESMSAIADGTSARAATGVVVTAAPLPCSTATPPRR